MLQQISSRGIDHRQTRSQRKPPGESGNWKAARREIVQVIRQRCLRRAAAWICRVFDPGQLLMSCPGASFAPVVVLLHGRAPAD